MSLEKIIGIIVDKKSIFLAGIILLVFIVIAVVLYGDYSTKMDVYKDQSQKSSQKMDRISQFKNSNSDLKRFLSSLPKPMSMDGLIDLVADYAAKNHISITTIFSNKDIQRNEYADSARIMMTVKADNFKDLISFFHVLETSTYLFKMQSWTGNGDAESGSIDSDITIVATQIKI